MTTNLTHLNLRLQATGRRVAGFLADTNIHQVAMGCAVLPLSNPGCAVRQTGKTVCCREATEGENRIGEFGFASSLHSFHYGRQGRTSSGSGGLAIVRH